jgi:hypothetical protein
MRENYLGDNGHVDESVYKHDLDTAMIGKKKAKILEDNDVTAGHGNGIPKTPSIYHELKNSKSLVRMYVFLGGNDELIRSLIPTLSVDILVRWCLVNVPIYPCKKVPIRGHQKRRGNTDCASTS